MRPFTFGIFCVLSAIAIFVAWTASQWRKLLAKGHVLAIRLFPDRFGRLMGQPLDVSRRHDDGHSNGWTVLLVAALAFATMGTAIRLSDAPTQEPVAFGQGSLGVGLLSAAVGLFVIAFYYNGKARRDEHNLTDLRFEHDLLRYKVEPFESRAEKLLSVNQVQLRRYYELNLQQARAVFMVGIGCIGAGLVVVGVTLWIIRSLGISSESANAAQLCCKYP